MTTVKNAMSVDEFKNHYEELKSLTNPEVRKEMLTKLGFTVYEYRKYSAMVAREETQNNVNKVQALSKAGYSIKDIANTLGCSESRVANYLSRK